jgi:hypothetical protein
VFKAQIGKILPGLLDHGSGAIDPHYLRAEAADFSCELPCSAAHIQDALAWLRRELGQQIPAKLPDERMARLVQFRVPAFRG